MAIQIVGSVTDGKLYFLMNQQIEEIWSQETESLIKKANLQWPKLLAVTELSITPVPGFGEYGKETKEGTYREETYLLIRQALELSNKKER